MKVTEIKTFIYRGSFNWLLVKVETDEGISGWGEATTQSVDKATEIAILEMGEHYLLGKDPRQIELHFSTMLRNSYWRPSLVLYSAISGLETAMWDILGKSLNVPIYTLLGGICNPRLKVYHNGWWFGAKSHRDYARLAKETVVSKGAKALKFDPLQGCNYFIDREQFKEVVEAIQLVREAVGDDVELMIDVHGKVSPDNSIKLARAVEQYRPYWWEEPIPTDASLDDLARVASSINIPVVAGERLYTRWGFRDLFEKRAATIINPDIKNAGGILETKKIADMANAYYVSVTPHSAGGPVLTAASIQMEATMPNFLIHEFFSPDMPYYEETVKDPFPVIKDGFVELPTKPGLGIELNEEALSKRPYKYFNLSGLWDTHEQWSAARTQ